MDPSNKGKIYRALENAIDKDLLKYNFTTHKLIGELSSMIITTNYDRAIETALPTFKKIVDDKFQIGSFTDYDKYIFKIHGCIDSPTNCVLFTEDYKKIYEGSTKFERQSQ